MLTQMIGTDGSAGTGRCPDGAPSSTVNRHPAGAGGQDGSGAQPGPGTHPCGAEGQPGGGLKRTVIVTPPTPAHAAPDPADTASPRACSPAAEHAASPVHGCQPAHAAWTSASPSPTITAAAEAAASSSESFTTAEMQSKAIEPSVLAVARMSGSRLFNSVLARARHLVLASSVSSWSVILTGDRGVRMANVADAR
jgi:hypothetical protein